MNLFDDILKGFKEAYARKIEESGHNASGLLGKSMSWDANIDGKGYHITITLPDYAYWLENGRKPGKFPPIEKIKEWIRIKPILPKPLSSGKLPTENQLAYLIGRKISLEGTKPTHIFEDTMNEFSLMNKIYKIVGKKIQDEIKDSFNFTMEIK